MQISSISLRTQPIGSRFNSQTMSGNKLLHSTFQRTHSTSKRLLLPQRFHTFSNPKLSNVRVTTGSYLGKRYHKVDALVVKLIREKHTAPPRPQNIEAWNDVIPAPRSNNYGELFKHRRQRVNGSSKSKQKKPSVDEASVLSSKRSTLCKERSHDSQATEPPADRKKRTDAKAPVQSQENANEVEDKALPSRNLREDLSFLDVMYVTNWERDQFIPQSKLIYDLAKSARGRFSVQYRPSWAPYDRARVDYAKWLRNLSDNFREDGYVNIFNNLPHLAFVAYPDSPEKRAVWLGPKDMPVKDARKMLGPKAFIGCTVYNFTDYEKLLNDYELYDALGAHWLPSPETMPNGTPWGDLIKNLFNYEKEKPIVLIGGIDSMEKAQEALMFGPNVCLAIAGWFARDPERAGKFAAQIVEAQNRMRASFVT